jgi:hypothetical protein
VRNSLLAPGRKTRPAKRRRPYGSQERLIPEWLVQQIRRAHLHRLHRRRDIGMCCHQYDWPMHAHFAQSVQKGESVQARRLDFRDDASDISRLKCADCLEEGEAGDMDGDGKPFRQQEQSDCLANSRVVVDHMHDPPSMCTMRLGRFPQERAHVALPKGFLFWDHQA